MNNATHFISKTTVNGKTSVKEWPASDLDKVKAQAVSLREMGHKVKLTWVRETPAQAAQRVADQAKSDADFKARILAMVGHEDDDGTAADIARENGWL